jgi:hypothetical protein
MANGSRPLWLAADARQLGVDQRPVTIGGSELLGIGTRIGADEIVNNALLDQEMIALTTVASAKAGTSDPNP